MLRFCFEYFIQLLLCWISFHVGTTVTLQLENYGQSCMADLTLRSGAVGACDPAISLTIAHLSSVPVVAESNSALPSLSSGLTTSTTTTAAPTQPTTIGTTCKVLSCTCREDTICKQF